MDATFIKHTANDPEDGFNHNVLTGAWIPS